MLLSDVLEIRPYEPASLSDNIVAQVCIAVVAVFGIAFVVMLFKWQPSLKMIVTATVTALIIVAGVIVGVKSIVDAFPAEFEKRSAEAMNVAHQIGMSEDDMRLVLTYGVDMKHRDVSLLVTGVDGNAIEVSPIIERKRARTGVISTVVGYRFYPLEDSVEETRTPYITLPELKERYGENLLE